AIRRPAGLRALGDGLGIGAIPVHQPYFREAAAQPGVHDPFAVRRKPGISVGFLALADLPGVLTAGVHGPDLQDAAAVADENHGALETGQIDFAVAGHPIDVGIARLASRFRIGLRISLGRASDDGTLV